jgi:DNA-binding response OmpR family regulator
MQIHTGSGNVRSFGQAKLNGERPGAPERHVRAPSRGHLLFIGSALRDAAAVSRAARALQFDSTWARCGAEGLRAARSSDVDLLFVDHDLSDMSGLDVARMLRETDPDLRSLLLGDPATLAMAKHARRAGALGVVAKPLSTKDLVAAVQSARSTNHTTANAPELLDEDLGALPTARRAACGSIADRWALMVLRTIDAEVDPKTVGIWGQAIGVSRSVLSECCRLVHVAARDARDFARLIRAICRSGDRWQPETVLDLADMRTLKKLLERGGFARQVTWTPTLEEFLERQEWISGTNPGMLALRRLLSDGAFD